MRLPYVCVAAIGTILWLPGTPACAWEVGEHRQLGDSAYSSVMDLVESTPAENGENIDVSGFLPRDVTFGQLSARFAVDDMSRNRFHNRGLTILEQLSTLTPDIIEESWTDILEWANNVGPADTFHIAVSPPRLNAENSVSTYLLYHLMAMRMMNQIKISESDPGNSIRLAVILEAVAQGYLADSFSAGHILTPVSDWLAPLHPTNTKETHNQYRNLGVYVINSAGDVWQTFGDRLLQWYAPTYEPVFEASCSSLKELLAVYFHSSDADMPAELRTWLDEHISSNGFEQVVDSWLASDRGDVYYSSRSVPTLILMPMPVAASWSFRTQETDTHGFHQRYHYPQLRERDLHDPDLENIDQRFLYTRSAVPEWMVPPPFLDSAPASPDSLIRRHPDWASVRWVQDRHIRPSHKGLLLHLGGQFVTAEKRYESSGFIGAGYGLWDDLLIIKSVSASVFVLPSVYEPDRLLLATSAGFDIPFDVIAWLAGIRIEGGGAFGLRSEYSRGGGLFTLGIDSSVLPLGFTNAGITFRLKYQWLYLDRTFHGPSLELIFH